MELTLEEIVQAICHLNVESHFIDLDGLPPEVLVYEALVGLEGIKTIVSFVYCQHSTDIHLHLNLNTSYNKASREWIHTTNPKALRRTTLFTREKSSRRVARLANVSLNKRAIIHSILLTK